MAKGRYRPALRSAGRPFLKQLGRQAIKAGVIGDADLDRYAAKLKKAATDDERWAVLMSWVGHMTTQLCKRADAKRKLVAGKSPSQN